MTKLKYLSLLLSSLFLAACSGSTTSGGGDEANKNQFSVNAPVSPNDTAWLFPITDAGRPQPFVSLQSQADIPGRDNFDRIVSRARAQGVFFNDVLSDESNWAMVSFRYTPCEFFAGESNPCKEQLRFVYQPMDLSENGAFLDYSLHVVYEYNADDEARASELMAAVYRLREFANGKTDNKPLAVHPVLEDRVERAVYFNEILNSIWRPFVLDRDPTAITFMGLGVADEGGVNLGEWRFMAGRIDLAGRWNQTILPDGSGRNIEVLGVDDQTQLIFSNITDRVEFNILEGGRVSETAAAAVLVPHVSNEHNVNCASCHVVGNQLFRDNPSRMDLRNFDRDQFNSELINFLGGEAGFNNNLISNEFKSGMFSIAAGIPQSGPVAPEDEVVTRMFGYMHSQPVISQRMAFDNGMAVNRMNQVIQMDQVAESQTTRSCSTFAQSFNVMVCLFEGNLNTSLEDCLIQACSE